MQLEMFIYINKRKKAAKVMQLFFLKEWDEVPY